GLAVAKTDKDSWASPAAALVALLPVMLVKDQDAAWAAPDRAIAAAIRAGRRVISSRSLTQNSLSSRSLRRRDVDARGEKARIRAGFSQPGVPRAEGGKVGKLFGNGLGGIRTHDPPRVKRTL